MESDWQARVTLLKEESIAEATLSTYTNISWQLESQTVSFESQMWTLFANMQESHRLGKLPVPVPPLLKT